MGGTFGVSKDPLYFFDESQMGQWARGQNWQSHSLGLASAWPEALKTALAILFRSPYPMLLFWESDAFIFFNDSFLAIKGELNLMTAFGQSAPQHWPQLWPDLKAQIQNVWPGWRGDFAPLMGHDGRSQGVIVHLSPEENEMARGEARLHQALRAGQIGFWDLHVPSAQLTLSEALIEDWGLDLSQFNGELASCLHYIHSDDRPRMRQVFAALLTSEAPEEFEFRVQHPQAGIQWIQAKCRKQKNASGEIDRLIGITANITELRRAKIEAERANEIKSAFLANMSHEIRTPLGAILGYADLLKDPGLSPVERVQFLETVIRNGRALTRIMDDILDLSKVEADRLEIETVEFSFFELLGEVLDLFRERARSKSLYLISNIGPDVPARIASDSSRLRQILLNILGNAIKFTAEGGVAVSVSARHYADHVAMQIDVADTGIGFSADQKLKLFAPFAQGDSGLTRRYGGMGLGLVLARRLARALGGDIEVTPQSELGSVFTITFKAQTVAPANYAKDLYRQSLKLRSQIEGARVLIADDNLATQSLARHVLEYAGVQVFTADNGEAAVQLALKEKLDVIFMDLSMPIMDGFDAVRSLRKACFAKPIVALVPESFRAPEVDIRAAGFAEQLSKPLDSSSILRVVAQFYRAKSSLPSSSSL